jgi:hypothetical protein
MKNLNVKIDGRNENRKVIKIRNISVFSYIIPLNVPQRKYGSYNPNFPSERYFCDIRIWE